MDFWDSWVILLGIIWISIGFLDFHYIVGIFGISLGFFGLLGFFLDISVRCTGLFRVIFPSIMCVCVSFFVYACACLSVGTTLFVRLWMSGGGDRLRRYRHCQLISEKWWLTRPGIRD